MMRLGFGDCVFDPDRRELTRAGALVHAGPKTLRLLEVLLEARPRALTKDDIHKAIWPGTFVSDATLTSLVAELRAAIGDDARTPGLVRTIHGFGYVFCGDVAPAATPAAGVREPIGWYRIMLGEREIVLPYGEHILGRSKEATVFVDDGGVSRQHARITIDGSGATLEDLGSKNGTMLNGHAIEVPTLLADGAVIVLGATALKFRVFRAVGSTETVVRRRKNHTPDTGD
jgi:DNA-binding winged helix-turn-helix (wHTH) protein